MAKQSTKGARSKDTDGARSASALEDAGFLARLVVATGDQEDAGDMGVVRGLTAHALMLAEAATTELESEVPAQMMRGHNLLDACARTLGVLDELLNRLEPTMIPTRKSVAIDNQAAE